LIWVGIGDGDEANNNLDPALPCRGISRGLWGSDTSGLEQQIAELREQLEMTKLELEECMEVNRLGMEAHIDALLQAIYDELAGGQ